MTPDTPVSGASSAPKPSAAPAPVPTPRRRKRWLLAVCAVVLLAGGAAAAWGWFHRAAPVVPALPAHVTDPEVREAIERARQKVENKPRDGRAWGTLGMVFMVHDLFGEADACFTEAARLEPRSPKWPYARSILDLNQDRLLLLRQAAALAENSPDYRAPVRLRLAEVLLEEHELDEAERLFREEFQRPQPSGRDGRPDEHHLRAALGLGRLALARHQEKEATEWLSLVRNNSGPLAKKNATALLALLARGRNEDQKATEYEQEVASLPKDREWPDPFTDEAFALQVGRFAHRKQAAELEHMRDFAAASQINLKELEQDPSALAYAIVALNLLSRGQYEQALHYLHEGLEREPNAPVLHYALAQVLGTRAKAEWKKLPGSPQAQKSFRESIAEAQRATELRPMLSSAYLIWGEALIYLGKPGAAVDPLRQGVECAPEMVDLHLLLGQALMESGQFAEAETQFKGAQKLKPDDPRSEKALSRLREKKGL